MYSTKIKLQMYGLVSIAVCTKILIALKIILSLHHTKINAIFIIMTLHKFHCKAAFSKKKLHPDCAKFAGLHCKEANKIPCFKVK